LGRYLLSRLALAIPTLIVVSVVVFVLQKLLPGDAVTLMAADADLSADDLARLRQGLGLDKTWPVQYLVWIWGVLQGDLGTSLNTKLPVLEVILDKLPVTFQLATMAILISVGIGVPLGVIAALKRGTAADYGVNFAGLSGLSIPPFWFGIMLILAFSVELNWFPASGYVSPFEDFGASIWTMILPAFVLASENIAILMRHTRSAMLGVLKTDYVRTARAKGLFERLVVIRHALRNALIPVITLGAIEFGRLLGGAVLTEPGFTIPGFGKLLVDGVFTRDYPIVQGVVLVAACCYIGLNFLADAAYAAVNPRIRAR
jgi:peptide/nickel transport system permease protein